jgi:hypothetical protein
MLFRIERSATLVQVDKALQQKISRYDAMFYGTNAKVNIARDVIAFQIFHGLLENFS